MTSQSEAPNFIVCFSQAAQEKKAEVVQVVSPPAAEVLADPSVTKLPVGSTVSHVDYKCFEVGTGQVNKPAKGKSCEHSKIAEHLEEAEAKLK